MRSERIAIGLLAVGLMATGCAGLSQMQDSLSKFDEGAHSVSANQMSFFANVQAVECTAQFYHETAGWSLSGGAYDLTGACSPALMTPQRIEIRQNLLAAIMLYADKLQALASSSDDKTLDDNAQSLASKLNSLAKSRGLSSAGGGIAAGAEAAVTQLTEAALDERRFKDAKAAAQAMQPSLVAVADALKAENTSLEAIVDGRRGQLENDLRTVISTVPSSAPAAQRFSMVAQARDLYRSSNPFGIEALAAPGSPPRADASRLNAELDALVAANHAIAHAGAGGVSAAVTDLIVRAKAAEADQAAIAK